MAVPATHIFGMLNDIGNNFLDAQQRNAPLPPEFGGQPEQPGFFSRVLSGQNPFAQNQQRQIAAVAPAMQPIPGKRIGGGGPSNYLTRLGRIENPSGDPYATSPTGAAGEYQFIPSTWAKYGKGGDIHGDQTAAVMDFTRDNNATLSQALGRPPTAGELYLAHQQGARGALTLLSNPGSTPAQLGLGKAVSVNGGNPDAPASLFTTKWMSRFSDVPSPFGQPQMAGGARQALPGMIEAPMRLAGPVPVPNTLPAAPAAGESVETTPVVDTAGRLNMAPEPGAASPSGVPTVGAVTTPAGQGIPNPSMETLYRMMQNPYQEGIAKIFLEKKLSQGQLTIKDIPVNGADGTFAGIQPWFVSPDGRQAFPVPGAAIDTRNAKEGNQANYQVIGEDQYTGQKTYGYPPARGSSAATPTTGGAPGASPGVNYDLSGDEFLNQFPPLVQNAVKNYVAGKSMPTGNPRAGFTQQVKMIAQKYGNDIGISVDDTTFNARKTMRNALSTTLPNSLGGQINFGNTAIGHLAEISKNAIELNNSSGFGWAPIATLINKGRALTTEQSAKVKALKDSALHYGQEITKFYAGSPGGELERLQFQKDIDGASSPVELAAVIANEASLMPARLGGLESQIQGTLGPMASQYPVIRKESKKALETIATNVAKLRGETSAEQTSAAQGSGRRLPKAGEVWGGFKFNGGDPADKTSWEKP